MSKFSLYSGLFGYGPKGADGSTGISGFSIYFTDYDPQSELIYVKTAITNNQSLLRNNSGESLPGNRVYSTGELFVDDFGNLFEIDLSKTNKFQQLNMKLSSVSYFDSEHPEIETNYDFARFFNMYNASINYLIDNVYTTDNRAYTNIPSKIYGIYPKNFTRIEYVNVKDSSYNPFTLFSSGELIFDDDHKAIAIVRNVDDNTFHIGNSSSNIFNVNVVFDVSSLRKNSTMITKNTAAYEFLSNEEFGHNTLFNPVFTLDPTSFVASSPTSTSLKFEWDLSKFTADPSVYGELHIIKKTPSLSTFSLVVNDVSTPGEFIVNDLIQNDTYSYYMKIIRDGWSRNSIIKEVSVNGTTPVLNIADPSDLQLEASSNGLSTYTIEISTNQFWNVSTAYEVGSGSNWLYCTSTSGYSGTATNTIAIDISVYKNTALSQRVGYFNFTTTNTPVKSVKIVQDASAIPSVDVSINFSDTGSLNLSTLGSKIIDISLYIYASAIVNSYLGYDRSTDAKIWCNKNSVGIYNASAQAKCTNTCSDTDIVYINLTNLTSTDLIDVALSHELGNWQADSEADLIPSLRAKITKITLKSGTGDVSIYYNQWDAYYDGVGTEINVASHA